MMIANEKSEKKKKKESKIIECSYRQSSIILINDSKYDKSE
jgi:hypothetical protein